ncbi:hypothetical protein D9V86_11825 [Bacteroidetes/Chlorobi group bacterium ChocPot_Mid]|jgi:hypothetical protein|nr:MAG: hypothetical protein D9V86_11825 [Bacteroidetes/Chlorobi group bacterium ChocPot_Mid]
METISVELINPKAKQLILNLASLDLIRIKSMKEQDVAFKKLLSKLRKKNSLSYEEITEEVETVRKARYAEKKN